MSTPTTDDRYVIVDATNKFLLAGGAVKGAVEEGMSAPPSPSSTDVVIVGKADSASWDIASLASRDPGLSSDIGSIGSSSRQQLLRMLQKELSLFSRDIEVWDRCTEDDMELKTVQRQFLDAKTEVLSVAISRLT